MLVNNCPRFIVMPLQFFSLWFALSNKCINKHLVLVSSYHSQVKNFLCKLIQPSISYILNCASIDSGFSISTSESHPSLTRAAKSSGSKSLTLIIIYLVHFKPANCLFFCITSTYPFIVRIKSNPFATFTSI